MKKLILFLSIMVAMAVALPAQTSHDIRLVTNDTLTNADTIVSTPASLLMSTTYYGSVQFVCDSLTGNPAGTAYVQGSNDGINWVTLGSLSLNGSGTYTSIIELKPATTKFIRGYILGTGTATIKCNAYLRLLPLKTW